MSARLERSHGELCRFVVYHRPVSFLKAYRNAEALKVAKGLDAKVEKLLASAAA
jgi:hypothetical protein